MDKIGGLGGLVYSTFAAPIPPFSGVRRLPLWPPRLLLVASAGFIAYLLATVRYSRGAKRHSSRGPQIPIEDRTLDDTLLELSEGKLD